MKTGLLVKISLLFHVAQTRAQQFNPRLFCCGDAFLQEHTNDPVCQADLLKGLGFAGMEVMGAGCIQQLNQNQ